MQPAACSPEPQAPSLKPAAQDPRSKALGAQAGAPSPSLKPKLARAACSGMPLIWPNWPTSIPSLSPVQASLVLGTHGSLHARSTSVQA